MFGGNKYLSKVYDNDISTLYDIFQLLSTVYCNTIQKNKKSRGKEGALRPGYKKKYFVNRKKSGFVDEIFQNLSIFQRNSANLLQTLLSKVQ